MSPPGMIHPSGAVSVMIHYLAGGLIVCLPNLPPAQFAASMTRSVPLLRSDDVRAVNCPVCRRTRAYQEAAAALQASGVIL